MSRLLIKRFPGVGVFVRSRAFPESTEAGQGMETEGVRLVTELQF
jgi:hypothetical protein